MILCSQRRDHLPGVIAMPREARKKSESGIYHVMLRGINKQQIFEDEEDFEKYLQVLADCKEVSEYQLFAYCLMGNHIHLLIKEGAESLEQIFKRLGGRYVYWYNVKYGRTGHLFQDRFKSEPVETNQYFLTVLRYIHQNPVKAELCRDPGGYRYSSYRRYAEDKLIDSAFVFEMLSEQEFKRYHLEIGEEKCLDIPEKKNERVTDEEARKIIFESCKCQSVSAFQSLNPFDRDNYLKILRKKGLSIRQISRLTGISFNIVRKF